MVKEHTYWRLNVLRQSAIYYFILLNLSVYLMMAYDKRQAVQKKWRIPEKRLLWLGALGGGLGGLLARRQFHHKTQKSKFLVCFISGLGLMLIALYSVYK
jgi:uncharacterized membrane protein YsdA (DUF1294 family)